MLLHLIRHGDALPSDEDPARPLSPRGREDVRRLAVFLRANPAGATVHLWYSPIRRARETAALLVQHLGQPVMQISKSSLMPEDDPAKIARLLAELPPAVNLAIVGHEPHLSALATLLVTGRLAPCAFGFEKAGLLTLALDGGKHETTGHPRWVTRGAWTPAPTPTGKEN